MVTIGSDSHKRTHTFVAVDDVGRKLSERTVPATTEGHLEVLEWAERWARAALGPGGLSSSDPASGVGPAGRRRGGRSRADPAHGR